MSRGDICTCEHICFAPRFGLKIGELTPNSTQLNQTLREITEDDEPQNPQTCTDLQPAQDAVKTN